MPVRSLPAVQWIKAPIALSPDEDEPAGGSEVR